jgi:hypothetical protein
MFDTADGIQEIESRGAMQALVERSFGARLEVVEEHVRAENRHDLDGTLRTFGRSARYHDEACGDHYTGCFQDSRKVLGRIATATRHPLTVTRALSRASLIRARRALGIEAGHGAAAYPRRRRAEGTS